MNNRVSAIKTESFVSSTLYYTKEELEDFVNLFTALTIEDEKLRVYVNSIKELLANGSFDNLPEIPEERKSYNITLIKTKLEALANAQSRYIIINWFEQASKVDLDIELNNELIDRYCWEEFMDRVHKEDNNDNSFRDKLNIRPIAPEREKKKIKSLADIEIVNEDSNKRIYKTGIEPLDEKVKMKKSNFVVIAARTTVGKSLFMINQAVYNASIGNKILYISLEESEAELKNRVMAHIMNKNSEGRKRVLNNFIVFTPNTCSPDTVFNEITKFIKETNIGVVFIDYIQLMKYPGMGDFESLRALTRNLKLFAISRDILLITASQLKRENEYTGASLTGLWGSSTLEADANIILMLELVRKQNVRIDNKSYINISISKNRSGEQGKIEDLKIDYSNGHIYE